MATFIPPPWTPEMDKQAETFLDHQLPTKYPDGIDDLGLTRWPSDWRTLRGNGMSPDQAWTFIALTIDAIRAGQNTPTAPAGIYDVPWTPNLDADGPRFLQALREVYKQDPNGPRPPDATGIVRWSSDYRIHRANGSAHEAAIRRVTNDIFAIWGIPPVPSGPNYNVINGVLRQSGWVTTDDDGHVIVLFCHAMALFSQFVRDQAKARRQAQVIAQYYGGVRSCDVLGYWDRARPGAPNQWIAWLGKEVTPYGFRSYGERDIPATPSFYEQKVAFIDMLFDLNLKLIDDRGDMNAWSRAQKLEHMAELGRRYRQVPHSREVVAMLNAVNEGWQNGASHAEGGIQLCQDMLNSFAGTAGWLPDSCGLSAPGGIDGQGGEYHGELPDSLIAWSASPATSIIVHGSRAINEHLIPHYFGYGYDRTIRNRGKKVWNVEPIGGGQGVSVGRLDDVEILCGVAAQALATGQQFTFMSGNGVGFHNADGPIEDMPGFEEVARLPQFLPDDVATFSNVFHSGALFSDRRIVAANDPTRFDVSMHADGRFVALVHTFSGKGMPLSVQRSCSEFTVVNMVDGQTERTGPINQGETFTHNGRVRLVVGRVA